MCAIGIDVPQEKIDSRIGAVRTAFNGHDKGIANGSYKWLAKQIGKNTRNDEGMIAIFGDEWVTDGISSPGGVITS